MGYRGFWHWTYQSPSAKVDSMQLADIHAAHRKLGFGPSPLVSFTDRVLLKLEGTNPTRSFKVRGGLTMLAALGPEVRGIVGYSTGNHAQSLAYAAARFDRACVIVMPENPNPAKASAVRALGAELVESGATVDDCRVRAEAIADERGYRLVSVADEPEIITGVATAYVELFAQCPDLDAVIVPTGGGSGAAAACLVAPPGCAVIAVQSASSPAAHDSWRAGGCVEAPNRTRVEGLATGTGFALPQKIMRDRLTDFVLVSDEDILRAQRTLLLDAHVLTEGAGAAPLAALTALGGLDGAKVALICTGANASERELVSCLQSSTDSPVTGSSR